MQHGQHLTFSQKVKKFTCVLLSENVREAMSMFLRFFTLLYVMYNGVSVFVTFVMGLMIQKFNFVMKNDKNETVIKFSSMVGAMNTIMYFFGFILLNYTTNPILRRKFLKSFHRYFLSQLVMFVLSFTNMIMINRQPNLMIGNITKRLDEIMPRYTFDLEVRKHVNHMQNYYQCCGKDDYRDWMKLYLFDDKYMIDNHKQIFANKLVQEGRRFRNYISDSLPPSCCSTNSSIPCKYFNFIKTTEDMRGLFQNNYAINSIGCLEGIKKSKHFIYVEMFGWINSLAFVGTVIMLTIYRLLSTSYYRAVMKGLPMDSAHGYIFVKKELESLTREQKKRAKALRRDEEFVEDLTKVAKKKRKQKDQKNHEDEYSGLYQIDE